MPEKAPERRKKQPKPCICNVLGTFLCMSRLLGILPITATQKRGHEAACEFVNEKFWMGYSFSIQCFYGTYLLIIYAIRFYIGPLCFLKSQWYVMTIGYFVCDFETLITIILGAVSSKRICESLNALSKMPGYANEAKIFRKKMRIVLLVSLGTYFFLLLSHVHVASHRLGERNLELSDSPILVMMRSIEILYTAVEVIIVFSFCFLIMLKYKYLADMTSRAMQHLYFQSEGKICYLLDQCTDVEVVNLNEDETVPKLQHLENFNHQLERLVHNFNRTMGFSVLVGITSSLYTTMYYLYRFCMASENNLTSNKKERIHYVVGLLCRSGKLLGYMFIGNRLLANSQQPLEVIRKSRLVGLPMEIQQQVQTLMLVWLDSKSYLSGGGIIKVGTWLLAPVQTLMLVWLDSKSYLSGGGIIKVGTWLLAPILGNVITYLLVALQFKESNQRIYNNETIECH